MKYVVNIKKEEHPKMTTSNIIVLVAFAFYMLVMIAIGVVYSKKTKNNEDYFLGGRNLGGWTAALSAQASDMSGWLLMGLPGSVYLAGTGEVWIAIGLLLGTILNWYIVSSRLRKYTIVAGNSLTIPSFFQNRYRDKKGIIKIVSAVIIAIFFAVYTASAFSSGAKLFATLFGNSQNGEMDQTAYLIGLIIASVVILVYTFMGGFKASRTPTAHPYRQFLSSQASLGVSATSVCPTSSSASWLSRTRRRSRSPEKSQSSGSFSHSRRLALSV